MAELVIKGFTVLLHDEDVPLLNGRTWGIQINPNGRIYVRSTRPRPQVYLHRLLTAAQPGMDVDHANANALDNRRVNLRVATRTQNNANNRRRNPSGFRGVTPRGERWIARVMTGGRPMHLGVYDSLHEAARAYDAAARELFGEFARLNFPT